jgi:hypothetical protein
MTSMSPKVKQMNEQASSSAKEAASTTDQIPTNADQPTNQPRVMAARHGRLRDMIRGLPLNTVRAVFKTRPAPMGAPTCLEGATTSRAGQCRA